MKLSQRLNRTFILLLILVISSSALTSIFTFSNSLMNYIHRQREIQFTNISSDLVNIARRENGLSNILLKNYVAENNILLKYYNNENQLISEFNGIENFLKYNEKSFATKRYALRDLENNNIGYLEISYIDNVYEYDESIKHFQIEIIQKYALIFIVSMIITSILIILFSKTVTDPITKIQDQTNQIRKRNYVNINKQFNVYELDQLSSNINYLSNTLRMQENYRADYARDIAHELRTPMTNLLLHLEGIRDDIIEPNEETINLLISEIKRLNSMIDNLEISFNNSEEMSKLDLEDIKLTELIENVASSFSPLMDEKNIKLIQKYDKDVIINTDKTKLTQILSNILSNAIKAVNTDGTGEISIIHKSFKNREVIRISDNGIGISKHDIEHIFDRFYRVDSARNTKAGGHGLGLSITKNYIDLLNYNITVSSTEGEGTEFVITI